MFKLAVSGSFDAIHRLPDQLGVDKELHGHHWTLTVVFKFSNLESMGPFAGMAYDHETLRNAVDSWCRNFHRRELNDIFKPPITPPTLESIAVMIHKDLYERFLIDSVSVTDNEGIMVTYIRDKTEDTPIEDSCI